MPANGPPISGPPATPAPPDGRAVRALPHNAYTRQLNESSRHLAASRHVETLRSLHRNAQSAAFASLMSPRAQQLAALRRARWAASRQRILAAQRRRRWQPRLRLRLRLALGRHWAIWLFTLGLMVALQVALVVAWQTVLST